ncbi:MAG: glycosyltransferase family 39 protein, partial [Patescibacteria group bacterium]
LAFFGTLATMAILGFKSLGGIKDSFLYSLTAGFIGAIIGLLVNASYIDIFEASKVAYVFWGVAGLTMGSLYLMRDKIRKDYEPLKLIIPWKEFFTKIKKFVISDFFWLSLVIILAVSLRFYKIDSPVADWHSWRQADTSAVTRNFIKNDRIDILYPTYDDLSSVASGKLNLKGLRMVEFPLYNAATVFMRLVFPEFSTESAGRATSTLASVLTIIFIFLLCRKILSRRIAYFSALAYALLPYSIFYGRTILPDPSMTAMAMGANWFALKYTETPKKRFFIFSLVLAICALLIKPFAVFLLTPILYFWFVNFKLNWRKYLILLCYCFIALLPLLAWRLWISQFPEGIPANSWLLNGDNIRFKGAFWFWLFADRIGRLILGYWGLILLGFGLIRRTEGKYRHFPFLFLVSCILYLFVFATGNVRHDYYQILIIPSLTIFVGLGIDYLISLNWRSRLLALVCCLFMLGFGWYFVRDLYNINHPEIVAAGTAVDKIAPPRALVIAPYMGDTAFLYQTNRSGWPIMEGTIDEMIKRGADFYVNTKIENLEKQMLANSETPEYIKAHLKEPRKKYILHAYTDQYIIFEIRK